MRSFMINLTLAVLWMLLERNLSLRAFAIGFGLGFALLAIFRPVLESGGYVRRCVAVVRFAGVFLREYLLGAWHTLRFSLLVPRSRMRPCLLRYDVRGLSRVELLLLTQAISLTPGTTTVEVAPDFSHVILHALDGANPDAVRTSIDASLRRSILGFTR